MKTIQQARQDLADRGETLSAWARKNGFNPENVRAVVYGSAKGKWGESHKIAVKMGIKQGVIVDD
jgi:gp16 family phage-associated protein